MPSQIDKGSQAKRKPSSQPTLISNYFKKVESPIEKRQSTPTPTTVPTNRNGVATPDSRARPSTPDDNDEESEERVPKRARLQTPPSDDSSGLGVTPAREINALTALMSPKVKEFRPPPESPRTARYKYLSTSPGKDNETFTPEQLSKKKSLHEKFVAKLGRPDSMASIRRPSGNGTPVEGEEEEQPEEQEEEEEEEVPAAKALRGKYAAKGGKKATTTSIKAKGESTTKFTPLEKQFVELKKQYPDTLLLIEVGYKFRFFGEDARVVSWRF
jgi:DNA mismatch repair protein MSH3